MPRLVVGVVAGLLFFVLILGCQTPRGVVVLGVGATFRTWLYYDFS
ncbi:MAG: hypothetical protein ACRDZ8_09050 [Acidimicrobiales bacterium]